MLTREGVRSVERQSLRETLDHLNLERLEGARSVVLGHGDVSELRERRQKTTTLDRCCVPFRACRYESSERIRYAGIKVRVDRRDRRRDGGTRGDSFEVVQVLCGNVVQLTVY